jgi:hypothetical protein
LGCEIAVGEHRIYLNALEVAEVAEVAAEEALAEGAAVRSGREGLFWGVKSRVGLRLIAISLSLGKFRHSSWEECVSGRFVNFND